MRLAVVVSFVVVSRTGSVSGAARRLGYGQSTVTKHIQELEALVGVDLLERGARPLQLTAQGELIAAQCTELLRAGMPFLRPREQRVVRAGATVEIAIPKRESIGPENYGVVATELVCSCLSKHSLSTALSRME